MSFPLAFPLLLCCICSSALGQCATEFSFQEAHTVLSFGAREIENLLVCHVLVLFLAERHGPAGQGYCQGGFSADFTKVRETFASVSAGFCIITQSQLLCFGCCKHWRLHCVDQTCRVCLKFVMKLVTHRFLHSGYCCVCVCVVQDGRVVLGGPGSFYWQGELTRNVEEWDCPADSVQWIFFL